MAEPEILGRVAPGSTAYVAGNDAFTAVAPSAGLRRLTINVTVDAATTLILRKGGVNLTLNDAVPLSPNNAANFQYDVTGNDTITIRFGSNCNILDLLVTTER